MGTGPFAVPTSQRLLEDGHNIPLVVTRPLTNPTAKKLPPRPMYDWATSAALPIFEPESINTPEAISKLRETDADLFFVCDYGQILSNDCLGAARLGGINLHGSILPRHRGAAPVQWSLLRGDAEAGVTVIHMTPRLDAGPAITVAALPIKEDETAAELEPRLSELGVQATVDAIEKLSHWDGESTLGEVQDKALVSKAPRFSKKDGQLDFRLGADYLSRLIRACQPWPSTFAELYWPAQEGSKEKKLRLLIRGARHCSALPESIGLAAEPGAVTVVPLESLQDSAKSYAEWPSQWAQTVAVRCGAGILLLAAVQPAGKREMAVSEFLRGHPISGDCHFLLPEPPCEALCE